MLISVPVLKSEKVPADQTKIERHQIPVDNIYIGLSGKDGYFSAALGFQEMGERHTIKNWTSREEAEQEFPQLVERFRRGEYKLHIYDNGKVELEL